jgi:outer membrane protein assembly factor BamB
MASFLYFFLLVTALQTPATNSAADNALLDAAQRGDLGAVTKMLQQGANVNAKNRYNSTPLILAALGGHGDVVKLLVDRGADLKARETFYQVDAAGAAMMNSHVDVIRYFVERGAADATGVLQTALQRRNVSLLNAALSSKNMPDRIVAAAHVWTTKYGNAEMAATAEAAMKARGITSNLIMSLSPAALQAMTGTYVGPNALTFMVALNNDQLTLNQAGFVVSLFPTSPTTFVATERPAELTFELKDGIAERLIVEIGPQKLLLTRTASAAAATAPAPATPAPGTAAPAPATAAPVPADLAVAPRGVGRPWPAFRGAGAAGTGDGQGAVAEWDIATDKNIRWKTPIPGISTASPIVWGNRVYIATAVSSTDTGFRTGLYGDTAPVNDSSEHSFKLYALDTQNGRIVWEREVHKGIPRTKRHPKSSQAGSTPVTDGRRIAVLFGPAGILATYDMNGRLLWKKDLGVLDSGWFFDVTHQWGHTSSPIIYQDSVILQVDRQKDSYIAAFNLDDGKERWRTNRSDEIPTWGTPTIVKGKLGDELITNGTKVRGYDPETGKIRWTLGPNSEITIPTPVAGTDMVYVTGGYPPARPIYAIRPGASGDISLPKDATSSDAIAWSNTEGQYIPTPIVYRGLLYTLAVNGIVSAYDEKTGERVMRARVGTGGAFSASPIAADGRLYFASEDGEVYVTKAGREFVQLAKHDMKDIIMATPAISNGLIVIRTMKHVYAIGQN